MPLDETLESIESLTAWFEHITDELRPDYRKFFFCIEEEFLSWIETNKGALAPHLDDIHAAIGLFDQLAIYHTIGNAVHDMILSGDMSQHEEEETLCKPEPDAFFRYDD